MDRPLLQDIGKLIPKQIPKIIDVKINFNNAILFFFVKIARLTEN